MTGLSIGRPRPSGRTAIDHRRLPIAAGTRLTRERQERRRATDQDCRPLNWRQRSLASSQRACDRTAANRIIRRLLPVTDVLAHPRPCARRPAVGTGDQRERERRNASSATAKRQLQEKRCLFETAGETFTLKLLTAPSIVVTWTTAFGVAELAPGSAWISATPAMPAADVDAGDDAAARRRSTELPVVRSRANSVDDSAARHGSADGFENANTTTLTSA